MATKSEKAVNRAFLRGKNQGKVREEKHVLGLLSAIIIVLLFLLFAQHNGWWPFTRPKLGTAFYTNVSSATTPKTTTGTSNTTSGSSSSGSGSSGTSGTSGNSTSGTSGSGSSGSTGSGTSSSGSTTPIANFAAGVNVGDTEAQTNSEATGLGTNCSVLANASSTQGGLGQQSVCVYTEGNNVVTVTYLNGHVISASKSGF